MLLSETTFSKAYFASLFLIALLFIPSNCSQNNESNNYVNLEYDERYVFLKEINEKSNRTTHNDQEVPSSIFPYVVALLDKSKKIQCSGTIISPTYILTAAHCSKLSYVYAGKQYNGNLFEVITFLQHPFFSYKYVQTHSGKTVTQIKNDIAIVFTYDSLLIEGGRPIALSEDHVDDVVRRIGTGLGYGKRTKKEDFSKIRFADVELDSCFEPGWTHTICGLTPIYNLFSSGICSGDSGGPLVYEGNLLGIGSLGQAACESNVEVKEVLIVYTLVSAYKDWIQNVTKIQFNTW